MGGKASLILVTGFSFILGYISMNLSNNANHTVENMAMYNEVTASHNLATAGANVALSMFYKDTTWRGPVSEDLSSGGLQGTFTARMDPVAGDKMRLRSTSTYTLDPGKRIHDTVEVFFDRTRRNSFSMFAWMTLFEGNVFWIDKDTVWGRVHSNGRLHVNGKPVFMQKVTTAKSFDPKVGTGTNNAIFKNGFETGVAAIDFPNDLSELVSAANTVNGRKYATDIWVTLVPGTSANNDGFALVRSTAAGPIIDTVFLNNPAFNGVMLGSGRVNVQGTLDGKLSIASLQDLYIQDDVLYEHNPQYEASDDLLGLIAENNVVVADNAANNSNCSIQGSVFCRTGSFGAEHYNTRPVSGTLQVYGSIVQDTRGAVGTFNASGITHGFSKRYRYDDRLADPSFRPPYYPGFWVKTYAISNWWESYHTLETQ